MILLVINNDIRNQYTVRVRNKFDTLPETPERYTPNDEYENFAIANIETVTGYIPTKASAIEPIAVREKRDKMIIVSLLNNTQKMPKYRN